MSRNMTAYAQQEAPAFDAAVPILSQLLKAEMAEREVRSIAYHMKAARFPAYKDLSGFNFAASEVVEPSAPTSSLRVHGCGQKCGADPSAGRRMRSNRRESGGPGTGKSHVAVELKARLWVTIGSKLLSIIANACASSRRSSWSMRWSRKRPKTRLGKLPRCW